MLSDGLKYYDSRLEDENVFKNNLVPMSISNTKKIKAGGPVLCRTGNTVYIDDSELHSLIIGDTGSMKTLRFVLPLIYSLSTAEESMVIVDPKGELARKTENHLKSCGYNVCILNWRFPEKSPDTWNPLQRAEQEYRKGASRKSVAFNLINDLIDKLFMKRSTADKDIFWNETAGHIALGICKLILTLEEKLSIQSLLDWRFSKLSDGTLRRCFEALSPESEIYRNLAGYMGLTAENTKSCIESTFDHLTGLFSASDSLTHMMSESSFDLNKIGEEKTAVFLVVPDEKTTFHFLATLFVSQCYECLLERAEDHSGRLPKRVNFILEEFCNMPKLNDLSAMLTAARSRNIRFQLVIQSYGQLADKYGDKICRTVFDNSGNLIYLHTREMEFLEYISKLAGRDENNRPIFPTSRLQHLAKNETIIFHDRCYPIVVKELPLIFEYPMVIGNTRIDGDDNEIADPPMEKKRKGRLQKSLEK